MGIKAENLQPGTENDQGESLNTLAWPGLSSGSLRELDASLVRSTLRFTPDRGCLALVTVLWAILWTCTLSTVSVCTRPLPPGHCPSSSLLPLQSQYHLNHPLPVSGKGLRGVTRSFFPPKKLLTASWALRLQGRGVCGGIADSPVLTWSRVTATCV